MSELKRYAPFHDIEDGAYMSEIPKGEYVRFKDMQATVQPLVAELQAWAKWFRMDGDLSAANQIEATLAAYREAMGEKA